MKRITTLQLRLVALAAALSMSSCYTTHMVYSDGQWERTVAFGPGATIEVGQGKVKASTSGRPALAVAGGAFVGSALGTFLRVVF